MSLSPYDKITSQPWVSQEFTDSVVGPSIVGWLVQLCLASIAVAQFNIYLNSFHFTTDPKRTKWTAYSTIFLCSGNALLSFWSLYHYATWQVRDSATFESQTPVDAFSTIFVGIEGLIVQVYLGIRAAKLFTSQTNKIIFLLFGFSAAFLSLFGSAYYLVISWITIIGPVPTNASYHFIKFDFTRLIRTVATGLWLVAGAVVDIQISAALVVQLLKRIRGFSSNTDSTLRKLIRISLSSASFTAITALIAAILNFGISTDSLYFNTAISFFVPLPSLYALSLFSNLNARDKLMTRLGDPTLHKTTKSPLNINPFSVPGITVDLPSRSNHVGSDPRYPTYGNAKGNDFSAYDPDYDHEKLGGHIPYTTTTQIDVDDEDGHDHKGPKA